MINIGDKQLTAENAAAILRKHMLEISNGNNLRINSLSTDTCDTMRKNWRCSRQSPEFKHVFFIPCDSHSLQLLLKDILKLSTFEVVLDNAQIIAKAFKKSPFQLARLRSLQEELYSHHKIVICRWIFTFVISLTLSSILAVNYLLIGLGVFFEPFEIHKMVFTYFKFTVFKKTFFFSGAL